MRQEKGRRQHFLLTAALSQHAVQHRLEPCDLRLPSLNLPCRLSHPLPGNDVTSANELRQRLFYCPCDVDEIK